VMPSSFNSVRSPELLTVGGHAGLSETMLVLAFRPDLVDLDELPDGALEVQQFGILHHRPTIEPQWNPRRASLEVAQRVRESIIEGIVAYVDSVRSEVQQQAHSDAA
jgi:creatinine amidohydrolase/Fe(II)-dependent formamide hydrolase-like protein